MATAPVLDHLSVLADATRTRMLAVLERQELTVSELCDVLQLPQSTVSRHLKTLSEGDWVSSRREGTSRLYSLPMDELEAAARQLWIVVREQIAFTPAAADDERRMKRVLAARRSKSEQFFSSAAGQWDRLRDELFGSATNLHALLGLFDSRWTIADLGCGTGQIAEWIAPFVERVVAVDASPEMLEAARARLRDHQRVELRQGSLERLPLGDGEVDAALLILVLHHLPDPARALTEAARVLRKDGRLLVVDMLPHEREEYRNTMGHVWLGFSDRQVRKLLESAGFEDERVHTLTPDPRAKGPSLFVAGARRRESTTTIDQGEIGSASHAPTGHNS